MNALEEICFLEQQIHEQIRAQQEYEGRAVRARSDIKKLQVPLEIANKDVAFFERNVRHVQRKDTDLVNLNDFAKTKKNLQKAQIVRENAMVTILQAEATIAKCQNEVNGAERRISGLRARLSEYGRVIEFPGKKEPENGVQ